MAHNEPNLGIAMEIAAARKANQPQVTITCEEVGETLRRVAANTLEVAAQEMETLNRNEPDAALDEGRKWAVVWLQVLCDSLHNGEFQDHDKYIRGDHRG